MPTLPAPVTIRNWAGTAACTPARICVPHDEAEVAEVVVAAARLDRRVRVVGAGHSWNDIALTNDVLVRLDRLVGVQAVDGHDVTVGAGTPIHLLNVLLQNRGLALSNLGSIDAQTIAGAISTATHGSSQVHGVLSTLVVGVHLVDASGTVHHWTEKSHPALLDLARASLGCLGILTAITLRCEPAFRLRVVARPMHIDAAIEQAVTASTAAEYSKVWWLPHTDKAMLYTAERTDDPREPRPTADWLDRTVLNPWVFAGVLGLGGRYPATVPRLNRIVAGAYFQADDRVEDSFHALHIPMPPVHRETEYALPIDRAADALAGVRDRIDTLDLRVNFIVELRYVGGDSLPLSPATGGDACYIGGYVGRGPHAAPYMDAVEDLAWSLGGRPHWGKRFRRTPAELRSRYPAWDEVLETRARLDPDHRFVNAFTERVFGLGDP